MFRFVIFLASLSFVSCTYHNLDEDVEEPILFSCDTITWQQDVLPIITSSCATSGCHDGISRLDWKDYNVVKNFAVSAKLRTRDRSMPPDFTLHQKDIDMIACWVDKGAPEN